MPPSTAEVKLTVNGPLHVVSVAGEALADATIAPYTWRNFDAAADSPTASCTVTVTSVVAAPVGTHGRTERFWEEHPGGRFDHEYEYGPRPRDAAAENETDCPAGTWVALSERVASRGRTTSMRSVAGTATPAASVTTTVAE